MADTEPRFIAFKEGALILGLQFLLLGFRLGEIPLLGPDEPRYARVAVEMARAGEFVTPTLAGAAWLEKPPLYYWLAGLGFRLFGENEMAARWPAMAAALLMTGVTGLMGARLFGRSCGRLAMLIAATSPLAFAYGRAATMDELVAAFISGASGLLILAHLGVAAPLATPAAWALMAFAVLAKGPIGILIPLGVAVAASLAGGPPRLIRLFPPAGLVVALLIAGPWFLAIYFDQGFHFIEVFLLNHNLERFTSTIHNHPGPVYYYVPVLFLGLFPWSSLIAPAIAAARATERKPMASILAWALVPFALFSLAGSKLPGYIVPCIPPFAILLALSSRAIQSPEHRGAGRAAGLIGLAIGAAVFALTIRGVRQGEPWGRSAFLLALWLLSTTFLASRAFDRARHETFRILAIGASGFLLILTLVAPPVLEAMESGRRLFLPAQGREVIVVGAWRTAWMAGYFYNDGKVQEVSSLSHALGLVSGPSRLMLFGPDEWRDVQTMEGFSVLELAQGARGTVLARVSTRSTR
ncbi:MAG: glycosyltransferase family 39 protein [Vicinamibacteria bacterium]|nr:glycosyltransferase family 39 protein [Vicinamibacteria bacterium]